MNFSSGKSNAFALRIINRFLGILSSFSTIKMLKWAKMAAIANKIRYRNEIPPGKEVSGNLEAMKRAFSDAFSNTIGSY